MSVKNWESNLRYFYNSRFTQAIAEGLIGPFLPLFAFQLKATKVMIGLLKTLPQLASLFMQIIWSGLAEVVEKKKWLVVMGGIAWALMWIPIAYARTPGRLVFYVTFQSLLASMAIPAWTALLIKNSPSYKRGEIAGRLNRYSSIGSFFGNIIAGLMLNAYGFLPFLFYTITFFGILSKLLFLPLKENSSKVSAKSMLDIRLNIGFRKNKKLLNLAIAVFSLKFAVFLPSPFFAIYIVTKLGSSFDVAVIAAIGTIVSILFYHSWGSLIDYLGRKTVILSCLIPISFIPFVYALAGHIAWIYLYTIIGSMSWAGFNLAEFAYLSDVVPEKRMSSHIAYYNLLTGVSIATAPFIGGLIASFTSIPTVFLISTIGRILSIYLFDRLEEKTGIKPQRLFNFNFETFGLFERLDTFAATYSMAIEGVRKEVDKVRKKIKFHF